MWLACILDFRFCGNDMGVLGRRVVGGRARWHRTDRAGGRVVKRDPPILHRGLEGASGGYMGYVGNGLLIGGCGHPPYSVTFAGRHVAGRPAGAMLKNTLKRELLRVRCGAYGSERAALR